MKKRKRKNNEDATEVETTNEKVKVNKKLKPDNSEASSSNPLKQEPKLKQHILKKKAKIPEAGLSIANGNLKKKKFRKKSKEAGLATCGSWDVSSAKTEGSLKKKSNSVKSSNPEEIQKKQKSIALSVLTESLKNSQMPTLRPVLTKLEDQNNASNRY